MLSGETKEIVSTHSRTKAAARYLQRNRPLLLFQHTAARRRLHVTAIFLLLPDLFQHTAARRRLLYAHYRFFTGRRKFQHTAARRRLPTQSYHPYYCFSSFNTQPHEGGCCSPSFCTLTVAGFQHTAARRRLHA